VANLRDRTIMRTALDSALATAARARAAAGAPPLGTEALGVAARESTVAALKPVYDETLVSKLAQAWGALPKPSSDSTMWSRLRVMGQMPVIDPADSARVVAWSGAGACRVGDLTDAWKKLNPLFRPRVETPEQVHDLVKNVLFERTLRREAARQQLERHPSVVRAVQRQREFLASQYFVTREVYAKLPTDDATLRRYYDRDPNAWSIPTRLQIVQLILPGRSEAAKMAVRLRDAAEAESLVARGGRQGVNYMAEITARNDSALFAAGMKSGTGTVLGPDSVSGGWQVSRVQTVIPARGQRFEDVKELLNRAWAEEEGERRMQELLVSLRRRGKVVVNQAALAKVVREGVPTPPPRPRAAPIGRGP
jgi:parvulin-like peptidyl-prolyl cis-trans isomerase-like protein